MKYVLFDVANNGMTHRQGPFGARPSVHRFISVHDTLSSALGAAQEIARETYVQEVPDEIGDLYAGKPSVVINVDGPLNLAGRVEVQTATIDVETTKKEEAPEVGAKPAVADEPESTVLEVSARQSKKGKR